ncbi:MAG: PD-(D/E)XK nuclease family protein [Bacteroidales bacterium]|nr:PD-(D/E)XK nuclease family protein [Bacteroidales bacterium]
MDYPIFASQAKQIPVMKADPFLKDIARLLLEPGAYNLEDTCVVFPNKRARLYLSRYLGELTGKPVWAPQYITISEMMEQCSGYIIADRLTLLFGLYEAYCKATGSNETFDSFYPYAETLLADFDEIDKYLVQAHDLFTNLAGFKSLDGKFGYLTDEQVAYIQRFWKTFYPEKESSGQATFISLWEALPAVYDNFRNQLDGENLAYEGMAYRKAIVRLEEDVNNRLLTAGKYLFVGFNALNTCEVKLFRKLKIQGKAEFFWDYDVWYTNNDIHEAGFFIRKNLHDFPQAKPLPNENLLKEKASVVFVPVSSNSGQATVLPQLLQKAGLGESNGAERTAVVLADESLLIPVLYAIPEWIPDINVTMGYPLAGSSVDNLVDSLYLLHRNSRLTDKGPCQWYYKDILAVMSNPMLKDRYAHVIERVRSLAAGQHRIYLTLIDIFETPGNDLVFMDPHPADPCHYLTGLITEIIRQQADENDSRGPGNRVQLELLYHAYTFLIRLGDMLSGRNIKPGSDVLFRIIRRMIRAMRIPFSGEPLAGLQVLGMLETRILDFDRVILLSANEGILPRPAEKPSFVPYSLRAGFGLPTPEHNDAIYAYYFYRLIQRAGSVVLVYNNSSGGMQTGERSRFLHQLVYEMQLPVEEFSPQTTIARLPVKDIVVEKHGDHLKPYVNDGVMLSPSAVSEYLNCSLRFYFHRVANLPQPEEIAEEIDARLFGNLLHYALKHIYEAFGSNLVTREKLEPLLRDDKYITDALVHAFDRELFGEKSSNGNRRPEGFNLIVKQVLHTYIRKFIGREMDDCPFSIVSLEERYAGKFKVKANGSVYDIKVGGIIDRIDRKEGKIRIIDYKTGTPANVFPTVESLFDAGDKLRNDGAFQVLLYALVYEQLHGDETIVPALYFMRDIYSDKFAAPLKIGSEKQVLNHFSPVRNEFAERLDEALARIFNTGEPYIQTHNPEVCRRCPYTGICRRDGEF